MPRAVVRQNDFSFGEISEDHAASGDKQAVQRSLSTGRNIRIHNGHGYSQRFGSRFLNQLSYGIEAVVTTSAGDSFIAHIRAAGIDFCDATGSTVFSLNGAPWTGAQVPEIVWHARENELYVVHKDMWPQVATYADGAWTLSEYAFADGVGGSKSQLYYRFAAKNITMQPSARTGSVTVTFSDSVLNDGHAGTRVRYNGREILITSVTSPSLATGTVIDKLPPTFRVYVDDTSGFRVGEDVVGDTSGAKGIVTNIYDSTHVDVAMTEGFEGFYFTDDADDREYMVGPNHKTKVKYLTGGVSPLHELSPAAMTVWDEQVISAAHGFPGDVFEHAGRLGFADFPDIPDGIALSTATDHGDFDIRNGEADAAIFERLGETLGQRVRYCVSSECLIVLTDKRVYYVPQSADTPLSAATFQFVEIGPAGSSTTYPAVIEGGVAYVESGGNRVMGILSTGNVSTPYELRDLSRHSSHLIATPLSLAITNGNAQAPERYIFALNSDGTVAVMYWDTEQPSVGWTPWDTNGSWIAMVTMGGEVYSLCERIVGGSTVYFLERFDANCQMDASVLFSEVGSATIDDDTGSTILDDTGAALTGGNVTLGYLAGETVYAIDGTNYLGTFTVGTDGSIDLGSVTAGDLEVGYHFTMDSVLWTPEPESDPRPQFDRRRVTRAAIRVQSTGVYAVGIYGSGKSYLRSAYDQGDDFDEHPPLRSETKRFDLPGWSHEPRVQITRPIPHPVHILSVAQEVAF